MISMDRKYRTRGGREVRIYAVDGAGPRPVHGAYKTVIGWQLGEWELSGKKISETTVDPLDLVEVKQRHKRTYWLAHSAFGVVVTVHGEKRPDFSGLERGIIAITGPHTVEFEEGEGL